MENPMGNIFQPGGWGINGRITTGHGKMWDGNVPIDMHHGQGYHGDVKYTPDGNGGGWLGNNRVLPDSNGGGWFNNQRIHGPR